MLYGNITSFVVVQVVPHHPKLSDIATMYTVLR